MITPTEPSQESLEIINNSRFIQAFNATQKKAFETSLEKGWWQSPDADLLDDVSAELGNGEWGTQSGNVHKLAVKIRQQNDGEKIALMHAELSEALEGLRHGNPPSDHIPEFSAVEEELADVIIRIMDYAGARSFRVAEAVIAKMEFNATRPHKHGGKKF